MSKVFCDVCGTAFPENAEQCPICGSQKPVDTPVTGEGEVAAAVVAEKAAAKGGHFSAANVRKRNKSVKKKKSGKSKSKNAAKEQQEENSGTLVVVAWVLLVAIILVLAYIVIQYVVPMLATMKPAETTASTHSTTVAATEADTTPEDTSLECTGLTISATSVSFDRVGRIWLLEVSAEPEGTTDTVTFASSDENVATVSADGRITAVGPGEAVITVTCGNQVMQCTVICGFADETTVPETTEATEVTTEPTETEPTETDPSETEPSESEPPETEATEPPDEGFGLFRADYSDNDATLMFKGESFTFQVRSGLSLSDITWTSENPKVATVENGVVTAVGPGTTVIYGEFNGQKDKCTIRCEFEADSGNEGSTEDENDEHPEWPYLYPSTDVSIAVGETFELTYVNDDGECPDIDWSSDDSDIASVDGDWVTGESYGVTTIRGTYNGKEITCIVRVIN